jgi:hypothetical protein
METNQKILDEVFNFYVKSRDFNGIPLTTLSEWTETEYKSLVDLIELEVINDNVSIQSSINPHIISLGHFDRETQLQILEDAKNNVTRKIDGLPNVSFNSHSVCVYPSKKLLIAKRDISEFNNSPFTKQLALGDPQLAPYYFEIEVLDRYFRDPRFRFEFKDYSGQISYTEDENYKPTVSETDQIFIKTFGLGVNKNKERVAVVYLRYLKDLTPEHQTFWQSKEIKGNCQMLSEYYTNTIEGDFTNSYSIFSGFLGEQKALNDLSVEIFGVPLFNRTFEKENRPKEFTFFFIPTLKNYQDFVLLLDKMISDNLSKDFFKQQDVDLFETKEIENGIVERKEKGTLRLFEEWLTSIYTLNPNNPLSELFKIFKTIRRERQSPAHRISDNVYDRKFIEKQKELMKESYLTMKTLRRIFQKHPKAKNVKISKWLDDGNIKIF